ncbi:unnamed protein product [Microthlaspi erraticum]|uniref:RNase H type-1 domain-containing protein n=1 Tax=Microthlaspi erraticum TaxID=1685480 RepID=A0A6D2I750_9BRAS|nr:unnamed protein product [Microthlaspi erraticum]
MVFLDYGALAVSDRLRTRAINVDSTCNLCRQNAETICHVLFNCMVAQDLLSLANIPSPPSGFGVSLEDNMDLIFKLMEYSTVHPYAKWYHGIFWNIWKNRNAVLYAHKQEAHSLIIQRALEDARTWHEVNKSSTQEGRNMSRLNLMCNKWCPPSIGTVECNVHANWRKELWHHGGGWIARDHLGSVLFHAIDAFTSSPDRLIAELRCIIWSLQSLKDLHLSKVSIASDMIGAIDAITKPVEWPRYRVFTSQIAQLWLSFESCEFELEKSSANSIVRDISSSVTRYGLFQFYMA